MGTKTSEKRVRIVQDQDPESPREWDNVGTMVCWHRRYNLGDEQPKESPGEWRESLAREALDSWNESEELSAERISEIIEEHFLILPLFLYDHSGLTMSCAPFSCPWDSGQVGYIYCTREKGISECGSVERALECMRGEVETYDQFLRGDVYGFIVEERAATCDHCGSGGGWETVDSCYGFYGSDPKENGMSDHFGEELLPFVVTE